MISAANAPHSVQGTIASLTTTITVWLLLYMYIHMASCPEPTLPCGQWAEGGGTACTYAITEGYNCTIEMTSTEE